MDIGYYHNITDLNLFVQIFVSLRKVIQRKSLRFSLNTYLNYITCKIRRLTATLTKIISHFNLNVSFCGTTF